MLTTSICSTTTSTGPVNTASLVADHLYAAECALHDARQTHVAEWITAAQERLHEAIDAYDHVFFPTGN